MSSSTNPSIVGSALVKRGLADMLRGGVIMDVVNPEQAKIAEDAGAVAVMALERVPSDIRRDGGVARTFCGGAPQLRAPPRESAPEANHSGGAFSSARTKPTTCACASPARSARRM